MKGVAGGGAIHINAHNKERKKEATTVSHTAINPRLAATCSSGTSGQLLNIIKRA